MAKVQFRNSDNRTPEQTIKQGEAAGLIPTPKVKTPRANLRAKPAAKAPARARPVNTPQREQVQKLERQTAMY